MSKKRKSSSPFKGHVAKNAKESKSSKSSSKDYLTLPEGISLFTLDENTKKAQFDVIPYIVSTKNHPDKNDADGVAVKGSQWYKRPYKLHMNIGPDNKKYICLHSVGKNCPICDYQSDLWDEDKEAAVKLYPKDRDLYVIIPKESKKHEESFYVWDMSEKLFQEQLTEELEENEENEIFPDAEEGKTLKVTFKWKTIGEKGKPFPETRKIEFLDREEQYDADIAEEAPDLDKILNTLPYDELKDIFLDTVDREDDDEEEEVDEDDYEEEEDEKPKKKTSKKRKVKEDDEEEDDEEEDDEEEDDEEEEEKPKRKKPSSKKKTKKEEPEDEDDEEEEESEHTWKEIDGMTESKLIRLIDDEDLDIDPDDYDDDLTALKKEVAKELDIEVPSKRRKAKK